MRACMRVCISSPEKMKASENPVSLQILSSQHCIDMCVAIACMLIYICTVNSGKFNSLYSGATNTFMLTRFQLGFQKFLMVEIDGVK